jgi:hypothetical protein
MAGVLIHGILRINLKIRGEEALKLMKLIENYFDDLKYDTDFFLREKYHLKSLRERIFIRLTINYHMLGFLKKTLTIIIIMYLEKLES